jgi:hypothetical protein
MSDDLVKVTVSDGKYTFIQRKDGSCAALRYGEPWRDDIFDGLMLGMAHRIEELEAKLTSLVPALSYEGLRTDEAEAKLTIAMVGLVQSRDELDQYSQEEYPSDHPVHERYRKRDYNANPARIAIAKIKGEQP